MKQINHERLRRLLSYISLFCVAVGLDQITKYLVARNYFDWLATPFLTLRVKRNYGFALSLFASVGQASQKIFVALAVMALLFVLSIFFSKLVFKRKPALGETLILAGGFSNVLDRLTQGFVVDFIKFRVFGFNLSPMNIADILIFSGVVWVVFYEQRKNLN